MSGDLLPGKVVIKTNEMEIRLNLGYITLSSIGPAAQHQGGSLGQYCLDKKEGYYIQTTTELKKKNVAKRFLYLLDDMWRVGDKPGDKECFLINKTRSEYPPKSGWKWGDKKQWHEDPDLMVKPGPMTSLCRTLTVRISMEESFV